MASWSCARCTFRHQGDDAAFLACAMCGDERDISAPASDSPSSRCCKKRRRVAGEAAPAVDLDFAGDDAGRNRPASASLQIAEYRQKMRAKHAEARSHHDGGGDGGVLTLADLFGGSGSGSGSEGEELATSGLTSSGIACGRRSVAERINAGGWLEYEGGAPDKPSEIGVFSHGVAWISARNRRCAGMPGGSDPDLNDPAPLLAILRRWETKVAAQPRVSAAEKEGCVRELMDVARRKGYTSGKWMLFVPKREVDETWAKVCAAVHNGELGEVNTSAKVAPSDPTQQGQAHLICIYCRDSFDKAQVGQLLESIRGIGLDPKSFKADVMSHLGINSRNPYRLPPTLYNAKDF